jgi:hypothetical protein
MLARCIRGIPNIMQHDTIRKSVIDNHETANGGYVAAQTNIGNGKVRIKLPAADKSERWVGVKGVGIGTSSGDLLRSNYEVASGKHTAGKVGIGHDHETSEITEADTDSTISRIASVLERYGLSHDRAWRNAAMLLSDESPDLAQYYVFPRPESVIMDPTAIVPRDQVDSIARCIDDITYALGNSTRIAARDDNYGEWNSYWIHYPKLSTIGHCLLPTNCTILDMDAKTNMLSFLTGNGAVETQINDANISIYAHPQTHDGTEPELLAQGNITRYERHGKYGWKFFLDLAYNETTHNATLAVVYDENMKKVRYLTVINDADELHPLQDEQGLPPCGVQAYCIHKLGGQTLNYNPLCANDVEWAAPHPSPTQPQPSDGSRNRYYFSPWQWATIGSGSMVVTLGGVIACILVRQRVRDKTKLQFDLIGDSALGNDLLTDY